MFFVGSQRGNILWGCIKQSVFYEEDAWENNGRIFHGLGFEHKVWMR